MRRRRREIYEDKRLDWRDPDMPVIRFDGTLISAKEAQACAMEGMKYDYTPPWKNDPTYYKIKKQK